MHTHIQFVPNQINKLGPFVEFYMGPAYSSGLAQTVYNSDISFNNIIETNIGASVRVETLSVSDVCECRVIECQDFKLHHSQN